MLEHLISISQFDRDLLEEIMQLAVMMERDRHLQGLTGLKGKILACLFYEPSTRTRFSFEAAMHALGGQVISTEAAAAFSSATKGETLEDSIRVVSGYVQGVVLRHPETGSADQASKVSGVPVINAGDGTGEHPTQALLDLYTIRKEQERTEDLVVTMVGDLKHGQTIHSLLRALALYPKNRINLISPNKLRLPGEIKNEVSTRFDITEGENLGDVLQATDVLYVTRVQKERFRWQHREHSRPAFGGAISFGSINFYFYHKPPG
jgi:aspartate carbamoyltransferase catalytic subunit